MYLNKKVNYDTVTTERQRFDFTAPSEEPWVLIAGD